MSRRKAFFHHGTSWVSGFLGVDYGIPEPRFAFAAEDPRMLPSGSRVRTPGRVEGIVQKAELASLNDRSSYRPPPGFHLVKLSDTPSREGLERHWMMLAVEDPSGLLDEIKDHRDKQRQR